MVLVNLISFKDNWRVPFDASQTTQEEFTLADGTTHDADYMNAYATDRVFIQTDTFAAADYAFSNGSAIHFILPEEGVSPETLLAAGSAIDYSSDSTYKVFPGMVSYKIPKISFSSSMDLSETMQELGMASAFGGGFPSITPPPEYDYVRVSAIYQDCFFAMDEQGTAAEARTEIHMAAESAAEEPEKEEPPLLELHLTRPFLFVITAPEGYMTFVGVVNTPTA